MELVTYRDQVRPVLRRPLVIVAVFALLGARNICAQPCTWEALRETSFGDLVKIRSLLPFGDGSKPSLFAGGTFSESFGSPGNYIAQWDASTWMPLGSGVGSSVYSLAVFDDGTGAAVYAGGVFGRAGEIPDANGIARWDGAEWSALGTGIRNFTDPPAAHNAAAMIVFDDGAGPALYVGGKFTEAGGVPALDVARWDGQEWSALGEGLTAWGSVGVRALAIYDDGSGPALYAGGYFGNGVARWDGEAWSDVGGGGLVGAIDAMVVFDDGSGPALYAGGQMGVAWGHPGDGLARWDGDQWAPVGGGVNGDVRSMHVFDDGSGPALYVGGSYSRAGAQEAWGIAKWDGTKWRPLDVGVYGDRGISVDAMTTFDDGSGPALYVAGRFTHAGGPSGIPVENIARWRCSGGCYADCDRSGDLTFFDFLCFQNLFAAMDPGADCDGDSAFTFFDFLCFQNAFAAGC